SPAADFFGTGLPGSRPGVRGLALPHRNVSRGSPPRLRRTVLDIAAHCDVDVLFRNSAVLRAAPRTFSVSPFESGGDAMRRVHAMRDSLTSKVGWLYVGWLWVAVLLVLPNCTFHAPVSSGGNGPNLDPGSEPRSIAVSADTEKER